MSEETLVRLKNEDREAFCMQCGDNDCPIVVLKSGFGVCIHTEFRICEKCLMEVARRVAPPMYLVSKSDFSEEELARLREEIDLASLVREQDIQVMPEGNIQALPLNVGRDLIAHSFLVTAICGICGGSTARYPVRIDTERGLSPEAAEKCGVELMESGGKISPFCVRCGSSAHWVSMRDLLSPHDREKVDTALKNLGIDDVSLRSALKDLEDGGVARSISG